MSRINDGTPCARCGKPAAGCATIGDQRYCHGDNEQPTCYMRESWERSFRALPFDVPTSFYEQPMTKAPKSIPADQQDYIEGQYGF